MSEKKIYFVADKQQSEGEPIDFVKCEGIKNFRCCISSLINDGVPTSDILVYVGTPVNWGMEIEVEKGE